MRIAYMNIDEVNHAVAAQMAKKYGAVVCSLRPNERPPDGKYDAVIYNLDEVSRESRGDYLAQILHSPLRCPRAVHGYDLSDEEAITLGLAGIAVSQRLELGLIGVLCRTIVQRISNVPPDDALSDETWINVVN
jgi:hypothetical protein